LPPAGLENCPASFYFYEVFINDKFVFKLGVRKGNSDYVPGFDEYLAGFQGSRASSQSIVNGTQLFAVTDNLDTAVLIDELHKHSGKTAALEGGFQAGLPGHNIYFYGGDDQGNNDNGHGQRTGIYFSFKNTWFIRVGRYLRNLTRAFLAIGFTE
jgi:hypothetical protein